MTIKFFGDAKLNKEQVEAERIAIIRDTIDELEQSPRAVEYMQTIRLMRVLLAEIEQSSFREARQLRT
jgi:hypothetical protein